MVTRSARLFVVAHGKIWLATAVIGMATFGMVSASHAVAIIGDFETGALDAWGTDGGPGSPALTQSTTFGVTLGSGALRSSNAQGAFWGPATGNLIAQGHLAELQTANQLALDMTLLSAEINGGSGSFAGFAQSNELAFIVFSSPGGSLPGGVNAFIQRNFGAGMATDSSGQNGGWNGVDGTRAITWDLTTFTLTDPTDSVVKTVAQFLVAHPDTQSVKFAFTQQTGGGSPVGPSNFYFDNVRLVPEPMSVASMALALPALAYIARRRRKASAIRKCPNLKVAGILRVPSAAMVYGTRSVPTTMSRGKLGHYRQRASVAFFAKRAYIEVGAETGEGFMPSRMA